MKKIVRIGIAALALVMLMSFMSFQVIAVSESSNGTEAATNAQPEGADRSLGDVEGSSMGIGERLEYALQGTATGLLMVFAVLTVLCIVVTLSRVIFYDIPRKARENAKAEAEAEQQAELKAEQSVEEVPAVNDVQQQADDGELIAVITAAIATAVESGEYGDELAGGFRVVSFKRAGNGQWNKR